MLRATRAKDLGKVRATLRTSSDGLEADSWVPLEKMTTVNLAEDVLRVCEPGEASHLFCRPKIQLRDSQRSMRWVHHLLS